jgi:hypothetical protein
MRSTRLFARLALPVSITMLGASAHAQIPSASGSSALAEALFQQGRDLFKQERYAEACPKLAESQRLEPKLGTLLNLALCHEKEEKYATAWAEYTSAAAIARQKGQTERADFANEQIEALKAKLAYVTIAVKDPPAGLRVQLDDKHLDVVALNAVLPIDTGKHRVTATAPGKEPWSTEIEVPPKRAELRLEIPALEASTPAQAAPSAAPTPPPALTAPIPAPTPSTAAPPPPARDTATLLMATGFSVGAIGVMTGAVTGSFAAARANDILQHCQGNRCDADQRGPLATANALANASNVAFAIGAIGAGVGVVGVVMWRREAAAKNHVAVTPVLGPGSIGLQGTF